MTDNSSLPINIIVAPSGWSEDKLNYRRHHLARYLLNEAGVERIFWLYPYAVGRQEYLKRLRQGSLELGEPEKGITEVGVPDFKGMSELFVGLQTNFLPGIAQVVGIKAHCRVWFTCPAFYGLFKLGCAVIYDCSDLWSKAGADRVLLGGWLFLHVKVPLINRAEQLICNCCETVFATSKYYQQKLDQRYGVQALLVENGVDFKAFKGNTSEIERPKWAGKGEASLGFVGGLKSWKLDFALPEAVFRERPQWQLILIGPVYGELNADFKALLKLPNVSWEGMVPRQDLPAYLKYFDLGLLPYLENDYNQAVFPLKLYEYLACDLPVVGCGLPSTAGYAEEGLYSYSGGCPADYVAACEAALKWGNYRKERMAAAEAADWKRKFEYMLEQLKVDSA